MWKKEYSERLKSKLDILYRSIHDIPKKNPEVEFYGERIDIESLFKAISDQPFVATRPKHATVLASIKQEDDTLAHLFNTLDRVKKGTYNVFAEFINVANNPKVKFSNGEMKAGKHYQPKMSVNLSDEDIKPNQGVRINTGYVIRLPSRKIDVSNGREVEQPNFVIIPCIKSVNPECIIIPTLYARNPDDTGLFTINFVLVSGKINEINVVFKAYITSEPRECITLIGREPRAEVFEAKDYGNMRLVKNLKAKTRFDKATINKDEGSIQFETFNPQVAPPSTYKKQRLMISKQSTIFTSRKREWYDENLVTFLGYFDATNPDKSVLPKVFSSQEYVNNTHCLVFVESRATLSTGYGQNEYDLNILNGAFVDVNNYEKVSKALRQMISEIICLSSNYEICVALSKELSLDLKSLIKLDDYHRGYHGDKKNLPTLVKLSDEDMFKSSFFNRPRSVEIHDLFQELAVEFYYNKLPDEQLKNLMLSDKPSDENRIP